MKRNLIFIGIILGGLFLTVGCKPTEKGYKSAYDAALNKRQNVLADIDANITPDRLQDVDGMQLKEINGVTVYVLNQRIKPVEENPLEENKELPGKYNVAVSTYKMITNCSSQAEALKKEGYDAFPAQAPDDMYFTVAGSFDSLDDAVKFSQEYQKGKNRVYVGLHNAPVIIYSPK